jgi:tetratricopeptide (TPR) repeat protein
MTVHSRFQRVLSRALLTSTALALASWPTLLLACPLGDHTSSHHRRLHATAHTKAAPQSQRVAQATHAGHAQHKTSNELGAYSRDLPKGAAAPTTADRPALYRNLGSLTFAGVKPLKPAAQAYFDQGYRLAWGFNHAEAARAFRAAQDLDPGCVLCYWGEAWVIGPHINYPMDAEANARALQVLERARGVTSGSGLEAALVTALSQRYSADPAADRKALDQAYADAMEALQARFPENPDVALLTADALMNLSPWDYWADGGRTPKGRTERMLSLIEGVLGEQKLGPLTANPDHPGAIHLYIHAVEASDRPERAARHAARLAALMPGAGHLVHMPSHIWYRLGRWRESLDANLAAAAVDEALIRQGGTSLLYSEGYYAHNVHFVMASALMGGDGATALTAADKLRGIVSDRTKREVPWTQPIAAAVFNAHARFSDPQTILGLEQPGPEFPFVLASWHYARGVALARLGREDEARREVRAIEALATRPEVKAMPDLGVPGPDVMTIEARIIEARLAQAKGRLPEAADRFQQAAAIQDSLPYMEPPFWYYPVHQSLGAVLLQQGRAAEAQAAFRSALQRAPNNGWAASGLLRAAEAGGDQAGLAEARSLVEKNWFGGAIPPLERL